MVIHEARLQVLKNSYKSEKKSAQKFDFSRSAARVRRRKKGGRRREKRENGRGCKSTLKTATTNKLPFPKISRARYLYYIY